MIDATIKLLLEDMLTNARLARRFIDDKTAEAFGADIGAVYAATRAVEIVGEAASQIDPAFRQKAPGIPWREAIAMRNRLIHGYRGLQPRIVFETVRDDFPGLIAELEKLLNDGAER